MNEIIILCAKYLLIVSFILAVICWYQQKGSSRKDFLILAITSGVLAIVLSRLAGHIIYDTRPFVVGHFTPLIPHASDNGFPSDHTLLTSWLAFSVLMYSKRLGGLLLLIALIVGSARVAAGVHHPLDILGSFVISAVAVGLSALALKLLKQRAKQA